MNTQENLGPQAEPMPVEVARSDPEWGRFEFAVRQVSVVLRKLATAASSKFGHDCYWHAAVGQALLQDLGFETQIVVGYAAWRLGSESGAVLGHTPDAHSTSTKGLAYHTWLEWRSLVVDFTTYQFRLKMRELDSEDGGHTRVSWCPEYLILRKQEIQSWYAVRQAMHAGIACYEARPELAELLEPEDLDARTRTIARLILANPRINLTGPNDALRNRESQY